MLQALSKVFISTFYQIRLKSHNDNKRNPLLLCKLYLPWLILFKLLSCVTSGLLPRIACQRFHKVTQVTKKAFERLLPSVYLIVDSQTTFLWLVLTTLAALISFFTVRFKITAFFVVSSFPSSCKAAGICNGDICSFHKCLPHNYLSSLWIPMLPARQHCSSKYSGGLGCLLGNNAAC